MLISVVFTASEQELVRISKKLPFYCLLFYLFNGLLLVSEVSFALHINDKYTVF